jgi:hypothetical protein
MTPKLPPPPAGSVLMLTRGGTCLHDAFVGSTRTVCGGRIAKLPGPRHRERLRLCRRCASFRRRVERK